MKSVVLAGAIALALSPGCAAQDPAPAQPVSPSTPTDTPVDPAPPDDPSPSTPLADGADQCARSAELPAPCADEPDCVDRGVEHNQAGKTMWTQSNDLAGASAEFLQAFGLTRDARYAFNLCYSFHQLADVACARWACNETLAADPPDDIAKKAQMVLDDLAQRM